MISKFYLTYNPVTGNLTKVETGESKLYQGQVGTVEYYVSLAEGYENEWRPSDTVLMVFQRPDNTKGTPRIMTAIEGGWKLVSDGWETDIEVVETSEISVNLWVRRYLPNGKNIDKTTQQVKLTVFPSNGYTPLNISNDIADQILEMLGDVQAEQLTQAADIINITDRVTENEGDITALEGRATQNETDIAVLENRVTNTETDITALQGQVANLSAAEVAYDNEFSGILSTNVQGAVDELDVRVGTNKEEIDLAVSQISTLSTEKLDKVFTSLVEQTVINLTDTVAINRGGQAYKITLQRLVSGSAAELFIIVNELPEEGFPNKIYLVPTEEPESTNRFDEYAYIDGQWEHFGSLTIDLSDYYTKTEVDTLLSDYLAKNQGAENAGKVLGIDESGNVFPLSAPQAVVHYDYQGGSGSVTTETKPAGTPWGALPVPNERVGWNFSGWSFEIDGTEYITPETLVGVGDIKVYAVWATALMDLFELSTSGKFKIKESADKSPLSGVDFVIPRQMVDTSGVLRTVTSLAGDRFNHCFTSTNIRSLFIPNTVTQLSGTDWPAGALRAVGSNFIELVFEAGSQPCSLSSAAVADNTSLKSVNFNGRVIRFTSINQFGIFSGCSSLTSIELTLGSTYIPNSMFSGCSSLQNFVIPAGITTIGSSVFYGCSGLTSITIPDSVTSIGSSVFRDCSGLTSVYVKAATPPSLGSSVFTNTNSCPIFVPAESLEAYRTASGWSDYASRIFAQTVIVFDSNGGTAVEAIAVTPGSPISEPLPPSKAGGNIFVGWYTDNSTFLNRYEFTVMPEEERVTLYAKWAEFGADETKFLNAIGNFVEAGGGGTGTLTEVGAEFYVDAYKGNDDNNGSLAKPFKTIQAAVDAAPASAYQHTVINVAAGNYNEAVTVGKNNITIAGTPSNTDGAVTLVRYITDESGTQRLKLCNLSITATNESIPFLGTGAYNFENVHFAGQVDIRLSSWARISRCSFSSSLNFLDNMSGNIVLYDCEMQGDVRTIKVDCSGAVIIRDCKYFNLDHISGACVLFGKNNLFSDTDGLGVISNADLSATNLLYIDAGTVFRQLDNTFAVIKKTGTCLYALGACDRDVANDYLSGVRLFTSKATDIEVLETPTNYTPTDASIAGHLKGIDNAISSNTSVNVNATIQSGHLEFDLPNGGGENEVYLLSIHAKGADNSSGGSLGTVDVWASFPAQYDGESIVYVGTKAIVSNGTNRGLREARYEQNINGEMGKFVVEEVDIDEVEAIKVTKIN